MAEVLNPGKEGCAHQYIEYTSIPFDGQAWCCDICKRHERQPYTSGTAGIKMHLPAGAYIRVPNDPITDTFSYSYRATGAGVAKERLKEPRVIPRSDLERMLQQ